MKELVEFKKELKQIQANYRERLRILTKEIDEFFNKMDKMAINNRTKLFSLVDPAMLEQLFPMIFKEIALFETTVRTFRDNSKMRIVNIKEFLKDILVNRRAAYNRVQNIINAMENDKIINYIDLEVLLIHLVDSKLPSVMTCKIFGMAVSFDAQYLENNKSQNAINSDYVWLLKEYFNIDGSFKLNEDIENFKDILYALLSDYCLNFQKYDNQEILEAGAYDEFMNNLNILVNDYMNLLRESNARKIDEVTEVAEVETFVEEYNSKIPRELIVELNKYYRKGVLLSIPSDIESFKNLLEQCEIDEFETRYILGLINTELEKINSNKLLKYLNEMDAKVYQDVINLLNSMDHTDAKYYVLVQLLDDLKTAGEILDEACSDEEKEYAFEEITILINEIRNILYTDEIEQVSDNNLIFLCDEFEVPFIKRDSDSIDGSFYKMICNGLKKIRKENQRNFKLQLTNINSKYRMYFVQYSRIYLSFVEIDAGIYILIGANLAGQTQGYDEMSRRIIYYEKTITNFETMIKDSKFRNKILSKHEQYLDLFSLENANVSRKRD